MRLQVDGGLPIAGGIMGLGGEVACPTATRPGDVLHVESEIVEVVLSRSRLAMGQYVIALVLDTVGGTPAGELAKSLKSGGSIVVYGPLVTEGRRAGRRDGRMAGRRQERTPFR